MINISMLNYIKTGEN